MSSPRANNREHTFPEGTSEGRKGDEGSEFGNIYRPISKNNSNPKDLRVDIGDSNAYTQNRTDINEINQPPVGLSEPIELNSPHSVSQGNFNRITQLPTPILNNHPEVFLGNSHPSSKGEQFLNIPKNLRGSSSDNANDGTRVLSDYRPFPIDAQKESNLLKTFPKRFVSNSAVLEVPGINILSEEEEEQDISSPYQDRLFHAPKRERVYRFEKEIGKGNFSTVVLAKNIKDQNDEVAIKVISIPIDDMREISNFKYFIKRELNILTQILHPCLIQLLDYNLNIALDQGNLSAPLDSDHETDQCSLKDYENLKLKNEELFFVSYCPGGDLYTFQSENYSQLYLSSSYWRIMERIVSEIIIVVAYLHSKNIVHRDIKLENILLNFERKDIALVSQQLDNTPLCNLTDFGLSRKLKSPDELLKTRCGSEDYISPEILMGLKYNGRLTDSWAVGVLIYSLLENRLPFDPPPLSAMNSVVVSPSVIRRKRAKSSIPHRIARIDWNWFELPDLLGNDELDNNLKQILNNLKQVTENLLVRKEKRLTAMDILSSSEFSWIKERCPRKYYDFMIS